MSSPSSEEDSEEVEFVSEGPIRPVQECIDLLSDSDEEGCSSNPVQLADKISRHKARITSTLDRLAQQVAQEKMERAKKCRAFKEKQISQKVHGQELAVNSVNGVNQDAKRCVDMWLKMPGFKLGGISSSSGRRSNFASQTRTSSTKQTCPVVNCGRVYDNASLLEGHLKRFDHSPCDPSISLRGTPSELFACVACGQHFQSKEDWRRHLQSKISSVHPDGHSTDQVYQRVVCFACPACYFLFNLRDECLQHMASKNHFTETLPMRDIKETPQPVPVPQHIKSRFIALCKDTPFTVRCSLCHKVLMSHKAAQAHFNVYCRQGCAVAKAEQTPAEVVKTLQVRGQCTVCSKFFFTQAGVDKHRESTQHPVEVNQTMAKALLQYCQFQKLQPECGSSSGLEGAFQKRNKKRSHCDDMSTKRQKLNLGTETRSGSNSGQTLGTAWFCECGLQFPEQEAATKHLLAANQVFHQCGVCGKLMGEASIASLHLSRFHGGAHLSNVLYFCRKCKVEMRRYEDILSHVSEAHRGHTHLSEREVHNELTIALDAKPSTSYDFAPAQKSGSKVQHDTVGTSSSVEVVTTWMCRMCEDVFDSEADVRRHCDNLESHSFQKFVCGHCPQKFFKESTVRRHCMHEHHGQIKSSYFCGLCDSMNMDSWEEFLLHYRCLHSRDYCCMSNMHVAQNAPVTAIIDANQLRCPCMAPGRDKEKMKGVYTRCMKELAADGKCQYVCSPCGLSVSSYTQIKTHVHTKHPNLGLDTTFDVQCGMCQESFSGVPGFHTHYHQQHCSLEPCTSCITHGEDSKDETDRVKVINAVELKAESSKTEDEVLAKFLKTDLTNEEEEETCLPANESGSVNVEEAREAEELQEALQRSLVDF